MMDRLQTDLFLQILQILSLKQLISKEEEEKRRRRGGEGADVSAERGCWGRRTDALTLHGDVT